MAPLGPPNSVSADWQFTLRTNRINRALWPFAPSSTHEVLIYHAAQMIAKGTESRTCEHCGTTFLSGGTGRGKDKKRGDARFCSDECRWKFHNKSRRRAR